MKLIIGLGNPGRRYRGTRHNIGGEVVDRFAQRAGITLDEDEGFALAGRGKVAGRHVLLAKPLTYVNVTGEVARDLRRRHRLRPSDIWVVYDDLDLPLGRLRIRAKGSAGGHNGLKSIIDALGTTEFPRMRIGIGRPPRGVEPADHVLTRFTPQEREALESVLDRAVDALDVAVREGVEAAMNRFNPARTDTNGAPVRQSQI